MVVRQIPQVLQVAIVRKMHEAAAPLLRPILAVRLSDCIRPRSLGLVQGFAQLCLRVCFSVVLITGKRQQKPESALAIAGHFSLNGP